ncbi:hypothetical protein ACS0TY_020024 [Phlomoides rotata]
MPLQSFHPALISPWIYFQFRIDFTLSHHWIPAELSCEAPCRHLNRSLAKCLLTVIYPEESDAVLILYLLCSFSQFLISSDYYWCFFHDYLYQLIRLGNTSSDIQPDQLNASLIETGKKNDSQPDANIKMPLDTNDTSSDPGSEKVSDQESEKSARRRLLEDKDTKDNEDVHAATVENDRGLEADADSSFEIFRDNDELADEYNYDYDDYVDESMWGDEEWTETQHEQLEDYVLIDAHVLCTPTMMVSLRWSFFFDRKYYDNPKHLKELGGIDIRKYVAGGIVVFNLNTKQVKWYVQLNQSADTENFRAYIYSSPTVADLDGDGNLDILVGTSFDLFYVLDHKEGLEASATHVASLLANEPADSEFASLILIYAIS